MDEKKIPANPKNEAEVSFPSGSEIQITRLFAAPRALVWKAWTDPAHVGKWWGPKGFTTTTHSIDVKPGGAWRFVMHGPDGRDYQNHITYLEVVEPTRLVYTNQGAGDTKAVHFKTIVAFDEVHPGSAMSRVTMRMTFPNPEMRDLVIQQYGAVEGGKQHLANLEEHLAAMVDSANPAGDDDATFIISRVFNAPPELVFKAWTDQEHLGRWFGPKGMPIAQSMLDLRPGGTYRFAMKAPNGQLMWGKWVFREVEAPTRLVFMSSFSDAAGEIVRAPFNKDWPLETLSIVTLAPHAGIGRGTLLTMQATPINATPVERAAFKSGHDSMRGGWGGTLDQLVDFLAAK